GAAPAPQPSPVVPARDVTAPHGRIALTTGRVFAHGQGPRLLKGSVGTDPSGLLMVKLRLTRSGGGGCASWSSKVERFKATKCGVAHGWYFKLGSDASW